jgi:predicted small secreted protein
MKRKTSILLSLVALQALALNSCDTPTGTGAAAGAGAGAIIGNIAGRGGPRSTLIGAAIGAATGALIGHAIQEDRARQQYGPPPAGGYPFARYAGSPNMYRSPYTGRVYDLSAVPPGGLTRDVDTNQLFRRP